MQPPNKTIPKEKRGLISSYNVRNAWQNCPGRIGTVWGFYNNRFNLYVDPYNLPATSYYRYLWQHLPFTQYRFAERLTSSDGTQHVIVQTLGHNPDGTLLVAFGCNSSQILAIPPMHILYVSIEGEIKVKSYLVQFQPLPGALVPLRFPR